MIEVGRATTDDELEAIYRFRYSVYVEEMGRYSTTADHDRHRLVDPEDRRSWNFYASDNDEIVASNRVTWGGVGFSARQIDHYGLAPFLDELPPELLCVGERTMVAASHRGTTLAVDFSNRLEFPVPDENLLVVFGACEPHLLSFYAQFEQVPYAPRNINSEESGYLIPLVSFPRGIDALRDKSTSVVPHELPACVQRISDGRCAVLSSALTPATRFQQRLHELATRPLVLFDGLSEDEIRRCLERSNIITCSAGDRVVKQGGTARNLFLVLDGELEARDGAATAGALHAGDLYGETAFLLRQVRSLDVVVTAPRTHILALSERTLHNAIADDAQLASKLMTNIATTVCKRALPAQPARTVSTPATATPSHTPIIRARAQRR
jgi:CRP-like cAMP-binding protein